MNAEFVKKILPEIAAITIKALLGPLTPADVLSAGTKAIVAYQTDNYLKQQRIESFANTIAMSVTEHLSIHLESLEYQYANKDLVYTTLIEAVHHANVSLEDAIRSNTDRNLIYHKLKQQVPDMASFEDSSLRLLDAMLRSIALDLKAYLTRLPGFTTLTFEQIFDRFDDFEKAFIEIRQIVEQTQRISANSNPQSHILEATYKKAVATSLDQIPLIGAKLGSLPATISVTSSYVSLSVCSGSEQVPNFPSSAIPNSLQPDLFRKGRKGDTQHQEAVLIDKLLTTGKNWLLIGQAGSGKTTLLQWLSVKIASNSLDLDLKDWRDVIPFYIRLRDYYGNDKQNTPPTVSQFGDQVAALLNFENISGWIQGKLEEGRCALLIDGLDEVPLEEQERCKSWILKLTKLYQNCNFIVTTRPATAPDVDWCRSTNFQSATIQDLNIYTIEIFVEKWFEAVGNIHSDVQRSATLKVGDALILEIKRNYSLRHILKTPLLCSMLSAQYYVRQKYMPTTIVELYDLCILQLLQYRESDRKGAAYYIELDREVKISLLGHLAFYMIKCKTHTITKTEIVEQLDSIIRNFSLPNIITALSCAEFLIYRSGILRERRTDEFEFIHKSFQEFLAAKRAVEVRELRPILLDVHSNRELEPVVLFASGIGGAKTSDYIIRALLSYGLQVDDKDLPNYKLRDIPQKINRSLLLALLASQYSAELSLNSRRFVSYLLNRMVPPTDGSSVEALLSCGNIAAPLLKYKPGMDKRSIRACASVLLEIGTVEAFALLGDYAQHFTLELTHMAVSKYNENPSQELAEKVLSRLSSINILSMNSQLAKVSDLGFLPSIHQLTIYDGHFREIQYETLAHVQTIVFYEIDFSDLDIALNVTNGVAGLKRVVFYNCTICDLGLVLGSGQLEELTFDGCSMENATLPKELSVFHAEFRDIQEILDMDVWASTCGLTRIAFDDCTIVCTSDEVLERIHGNFIVENQREVDSHLYYSMLMDYDEALEGVLEVIEPVESPDIWIDES